MSKEKELAKIKEGFGQNTNLVSVIESFETVIESFSDTNLDNVITEEFEVKKASISTALIIAKAVLHSPSLLTLKGALTDAEKRQDLLSQPATWDYFLFKGNKFADFLEINKDFISRVINKKTGLSVGIGTDQENVITKDLLPLAQDILRAGHEDHTALAGPVSDLMSTMLTKPEKGETIAVDAVIDKVMALAEESPLLVGKLTDNLERLSNILVRSYDVAYDYAAKQQTKIDTAKDLRTQIDEKIGDKKNLQGKELLLFEAAYFPMDLASNTAELSQRAEIIIEKVNEAKNRVNAATKAGKQPDEMDRLIVHASDHSELIQALAAKERVETAKIAEKDPEERDVKLASSLDLVATLDGVKSAGINRDRFEDLQPFLRALLKAGMGDKESRGAVTNLIKLFTKEAPTSPEQATQNTLDLLDGLKNLISKDSFKGVFEEKYLDVLTSNIMPILDKNPAIIAYLGGNQVLSNSPDIAKNLVRSLIESPDQIDNLKGILASKSLDATLTNVRKLLTDNKLQGLIVQDSKSSKQLAKITESALQSQAVYGILNAQISSVLMPAELKVTIAEKQETAPLPEELKFAESISGVLLDSKKAMSLSGVIGAILPELLKEETIGKAIDIISKQEGQEKETDLPMMIDRTKLLLSETGLQSALIDSKTATIIAEIAAPIAAKLPVLSSIVSEESKKGLETSISTILTSVIENPDNLKIVSSILSAKTLESQVAGGLEFVSSFSAGKDTSVKLLASLASDPNVLEFAAGVATDFIVPAQKIEDGIVVDARTPEEIEVQKLSMKAVLKETIHPLSDILSEIAGDNELKTLVSKACASLDQSNAISDEISKLSPDDDKLPIKEAKKQEAMSASRVATIELLNHKKLDPLLSEKLPGIISSKKKEVENILKPYVDNIPYLVQNNISAEKVTNLLAEPSTIKQLVGIADSFMKGNKFEAITKSIKLYFSSKEVRGFVGEIVGNAITSPFKPKQKTLRRTMSEPAISRSELEPMISRSASAPTLTKPALTKSEETPAPKLVSNKIVESVKETSAGRTTSHTPNAKKPEEKGSMGK